MSMKRRVVAAVLLCIISAVAVTVYSEWQPRNHDQLQGVSSPKKLYCIPRQNFFLGSILFAEGKPVLLGAEHEDGAEVKRVAGTYIVKLERDTLTIEIYNLGTRTLLKTVTYSLSELKQKYPLGVSLWVEQDQTSAVVVFVPWQ